MNRGLIEKHAELVGLVFRLMDLAIIVSGGLGAYWLRFGDLPPEQQYQFAIALVVLLALIAFPAFGLYESRRHSKFWEEVRTLSVAWVSLMILCVLLTYLTKTGALYSRIWFGTWLLSVWTALVVARVCVRLSLWHLRRQGYNVRHIAILGAGRLGQLVARTLDAEAWTGLQVVGFFDDNATMQGTSINGIPVLGTLSDVEGFIDGVDVREPNGKNTTARPHLSQVWIALPLRAEPRIQEVVETLSETSASIHFVPDIFGYELLNHSIDDVAGVPVLNLSASPIVGRQLLIKGIEDRVLALLILVAVSPLMVLICILVKIESPGPAIFKQRRHGLDGKEIVVWKFRSMKVCEDSDVVNQARRNDPRVTRIGALLRKTSLDELPQLINVLQGTMSLVGPRPHPVALNHTYRRLLRRYMLRHKVKPGITGLAQVNGCRGETDSIDKMEKRIAYDMSYIRNWSLWLDIKIVTKTLARLLYDKNAY